MLCRSPCTRASSPVLCPGPPPLPLCLRPRTDVVFIWFNDEDVFQDDYFHFFADTPRPLDTLMFLAWQSAPTERFVLRSVYPLHSERFTHDIPTYDAGDDKTLSPELLRRAERDVALAEVSKLRDELVMNMSSAAGLCGLCGGWGRSTRPCVASGAATSACHSHPPAPAH